MTAIESASAAFDTIQLSGPVAMWLLLSVLLWVAIVGTFLVFDHAICVLVRQRKHRAQRQAETAAAERDLGSQLARIDADTDEAVQRLGVAYQHAQALIRQQAAGDRDERS